MSGDEKISSYEAVWDQLKIGAIISLLFRNASVPLVFVTLLLSTFCLLYFGATLIMRQLLLLMCKVAALWK